MTIKNFHYEVADPKNTYHLYGTFPTEQEALESLNDSYRRALSEGYDNRHEKWVVIAVEVETKRSDDGGFLKQTVTKYVTATVEFSSHENAFVFTY